MNIRLTDQKYNQPNVHYLLQSGSKRPNCVILAVLSSARRQYNLINKPPFLLPPGCGNHIGIPKTLCHISKLGQQAHVMPGMQKEASMERFIRKASVKLASISVHAEDVLSASMDVSNNT
jgi:hypothetical protein